VAKLKFALGNFDSQIAAALSAGDEQVVDRLKRAVDGDVGCHLPHIGFAASQDLERVRRSDLNSERIGAVRRARNAA
jgi:hypothetical protein